MKPVSLVAMEVYEIIERQHSLTGCFPTYAEIVKKRGRRAKSAMTRIIRELCAAGWLTRKGKRAYTLTRQPRTFYVRR